MGLLRTAGVLIGGIGAVAGLYVVWHWVFISDGWTAEQMDPWMLTSLLGLIVGAVLFFWPRRKRHAD